MIYSNLKPLKPHETLNPFNPHITLKTLKVLKLLSPLKAIKTLKTLKTLKTIKTVKTVKELKALKVLKALTALILLESPKPLIRKILAKPCSMPAKIRITQAFILIILSLTLFTACVQGETSTNTSAAANESAAAEAGGADSNAAEDSAEPGIGTDASEGLVSESGAGTNDSVSNSPKKAAIGNSANEPAFLPGNNEVTVEKSESEAVEVLLQAVPAELSTMTLREKIGQMLFPAFRNNELGQPMLIADKATIETIEEWQPGGIIFFSENLDTVPQTAGLIRSFQAASSIPLFMGVDEEGGSVSRLAMAKGMSAVPMPSAMTIGNTGDTTFAEQAAQAIGEQLSLLGFNMVFAPVADVHTNPDNPVIGNRAYGTDPLLVSLMAASAMEGFKSQGIIAVAKHFPGHGDTYTDTHVGMASVPHSRERMKAVELFPFQAMIDAGVAAIMTAHVHTPGLSDKALPATLNPDVLTGVLRDGMSFPGVTITDAMEMGAIADYYGADEAVIMAVEAGADMLLMPVSLERAGIALENAVLSGRLSYERINESVARILALKTEYELLDRTRSFFRTRPETFSGAPEYLLLVERIREAAAAAAGR